MSEEAHVLEGEFAVGNEPESVARSLASRMPSPRITIHLKTSDDVRLEMAKVYRDSKDGKLDTRKACQLVYILSEIRRAIETDLNERRIEAMERELLLLGGPVEGGV